VEHVVQLPALEAEYWPVVQEAQVVEPALAWKVPPGQLVQELAPDAEYVPGTQLEQEEEAVTPVVLKYFPAAQLLQDVCVVLAW